ncbi:MAG: type II toxin-antitoxin system VapC family toxin [Selenomonadaceae bacterium]|nr:type II toxin-antitoxin system VapC family toxin [Selenomonadaceae bacterium]
MLTDFKKIFIDTTPFIYFFTMDSVLHNKTEEIFKAIIKSDCDIVTSTVTCAEYLVYPYRNNNFLQVESFWGFLEDAGIVTHNIDKAVASKTAQIRAEYKYFKAFDCMQLAVACIKKCDLFLTNDRQLKQFKEISCVMIEDWNF